MEHQFKTNYEGHDQIYAKLKERNKIGWSNEEGYNEFILTIQPMINLEFRGKINDFYGFPKSGKLLEVGCGAGNIVSYFAKKGYECTGVDISKTAINWAKEKAIENNLEIDFFISDITDMSFLGDESFDIVIDGRCLHCIIGEDRKKFYAEIKRLLSKKGHLIIYTMVADFVGEKFKKSFDETTRCLISEINNEKIATRYIGTKEIVLKEVEENGFEILEYFFRKRTDFDSFDDLIIHLKNNKSNPKA